MLTTVALVPRDTLLRELNQVGRATAVWIQTLREDPASEVSAAKRLREYYETMHYELAPGSVFGTLGDTASGIAAFIIGQFAFIILLLMVMAVVIGVVGSIALERRAVAQRVGAAARNRRHARHRCIVRRGYPGCSSVRG